MYEPNAMILEPVMAILWLNIKKTPGGSLHVMMLEGDG